MTLDIQGGRSHAAIVTDFTPLFGDYLDRLRAAKFELLAIIHLGRAQSVIARRLSGGELVDETPFPIRSIVADALNLGSLEIILAHNHPSGAARPSVSDLEKTRELGRVLAPLRINLMDHLIITEHAHYSMRGDGQLY